MPRVDALFRYPVKSMLGERLDTAMVGEKGLAGDRAYALVDQETGKVVSAKNPRRWGVLLECRAAFAEEPTATHLPPVVISLPDGTTVRSDDADVDERLTQLVGRAVRLETEPPPDAVLEQFLPVIEGIADAQEESVTDSAIAIVAPGTFFDAAPLHIVSTAALAQLRTLAPETTFTPGRFRPNIVVATDDETGFVDNGWVNRSMKFGAVEASVFLSAPRCVMTTLAQTDLPRDPKVLQTIAHNNRFDIPGLGPSSCVGVYAVVTASGQTTPGDPVEIS